ncbi:platelet glycoprotein Ib alpha chain-like [Phyllopteryx taeniolatus]|uniref:platelet glycoprotein Ib alpha chain-like n=1 Tax=Phyllopteryx taeniolatus TaxID=161469 RepID=UPI002AD568FC|nr:platelet glycoprotein Ib alpha chain-like [Phyllopteryx taeniolatus]
MYTDTQMCIGTCSVFHWHRLSITFSMKLFYVVLLGAGVTMDTALDGCHTDRDPDHRVRLNCTAAGFSTVPAGLQPTTEVLLFPSNQFSSLSWESFQIFSKLHELDLTANQLGQVTPRAGPLLPHLSVLRLGRNRLTSLPDRAFSACPSLIDLYLGSNAIESLSDDTFAGLSKLEILDLSSNRIRVLPPLLLRPLVAIETLYLESNQISEVSDNWFSPREEVPYLYFSANPWACFCELMYLHAYINDFFFNFYVRDSKTITRDPKSVVCHSPQRSKGRAIIDLDQEDLCPPPTPTLIAAIATSRVTEVLEESEGGRGDGPVVWRPALTTSSASDRFGATTTMSLPTTPTAPLPATTSHSTTSTVPLPTTPTPLPAVLSLVMPSSSELPLTWRWGTEKGDAAPLRHVPGAGVFCTWLLAANVCLCVVAAVSTLVTLVRLAVWYRGAYKLLSVTLARGGGARQVRLYGGREVVYRSVLFVSCQGAEGVKGGPVYRTTLHREPGTQIALQQWSDVMGVGDGGAGWRQRFSVLLRQEREGPGGGREERDWVVGAWLAQHLPGVSLEGSPAP